MFKGELTCNMDVLISGAILADVGKLLEYELADYISIPSSFVKKTFLEQGIEKNKLLINPYGVDLLEFRQIKKEDNIFRIMDTSPYHISRSR